MSSPPKRSCAKPKLIYASRKPIASRTPLFWHNTSISRPITPNSVGFGVSFPVPLWNRNRGNILAAEAAREQARPAFEKAKAEAVADIAVARLSYEDALKRWRSYRDSIRPKSEQIRQTTAYAYQKGGASLLDLLVAERNDNDIRLAAAQAASDTASAGAAFKAATQEIQPSQVKQ
jgi:cobalt-zinc-cadmium efflux system outer membrane protein